MADARIQTLIEHGDHLFAKKLSLNCYLQEVAENFYPERADFTVTRNLGDDFAQNLTTSYPLLCRRELGNTFSSMLRPTNVDWFRIKTLREDMEDNDSKRWLEWATQLQKKAMYDRATQFVRATKEGDHDFAAFGATVLSAQFNPNANALLYRTWHLRDVAWCEGYDGQISDIHRKWKPTARELNQIFKGNVSQKVKDKLDKEPYAEIEVRHAVVLAQYYDSPKKWNAKYISVFFEVDSGFINEEVGSHNQIYIIPRWQTVSGSQYPYSPATVAALPDARLIQAMTLVLLEAGQKAVDPPLIATQEMVRSDIDVMAGGVTWVDKDYDERMGEVLRPMAIDSRGIPVGMEMSNDIKSMISRAFFLDKLNLPPTSGREMTAFEISQRVQEYIRNAAPLFEPVEMEYNGALCEITFDILLRNGGFGAPDDMPQGLRGQEVQFGFQSPLQESVGQQKGQLFQTTAGLLAQAISFDPSAPKLLDIIPVMRDTLEGIGVPAKWIRSEEQMQQIAINDAQQAQQAKLLGLLQQGGAAAEAVGKGGTAINSAMGVDARTTV